MSDGMTSAGSQVRTAPFDVVALGASAGGHTAVTAVLQNLPAAFEVPIVVLQHLAPDSSGTVEMYRRLLPFAVEQVVPGAALTRGTVLVCPPRTFVELLPDGTFALSPNERGAVDKPIDRLLASLARSFGHRAIGVILTGMGVDGALGARALHLAGGRVIVQNEATAEFADMPKAAIQAGAADLVVPLVDIGQVIGELAAGTPRPQPRSEIEAVRRVFGDEGNVAARARTVDWAQTELGPVHTWSPALRSVVRLAVDSPYPVALWLGAHATLIANEAALPSLGPLFPGGFAKPYPETAPARYAFYRQSIARVWAGEWVMQEAYASPLAEEHAAEEAAEAAEEVGADSWWNVSFTPIREADGRVIGIHIAWQERTASVLSARRLQLLNRLAAAETAGDRRAALAGALRVLEGSPDISFAAAYLLDAAGKQALLAGTAGVAEGDALAPRQLAARTAWEAWPLQQVLEQGKCVVVDDVQARLAPTAAPTPAESRGTRAAAVVCPLRDRVEGRAIGALVLGTNPRLARDEVYHDFLTLLGDTIGAKAAAAEARRRELERLEQLTELDRTKAEFFANISHEFRTPLTLILAPLEDLLLRRAELPPPLGDEVEVAANNSRRLLRLVNSLLDFSQIETRRQGAEFEPTDLCALTTDIASAFRGAVEAAGLRLRVECAPNLPPVWVDRAMWEKIVSNLLSNAFKFTFEGEIAVELHALTLHAELLVRDTGIGIPQEEMANIFQRFHRVRGARARTVEGSGIGLSIVDDLVKRMGGQLRARSKEDEGTDFTIWIPYKAARIRTEAKAATEGPEGPSARGPSARGPAFAGHTFAGQLAEEAARWTIAGQALPAEILDDLLVPGPAGGEARLGTILVADDNADMRSYLQRLLGGRWHVELAPDGEAALKIALEAARDPAGGGPPDVILADVMMSGLDGFQLIQRVRAEPLLMHTPVILLTARAGEEAAIQGLEAGAGDYIAKPFSPRELLARIQVVHTRAQAQAVLRERAARQAFLVKLGDGLRPLADPVQIQATAAQIAMDYYGAERCYYCEIENGSAIIRRDAARAGLPSIAGVYPLAELPLFVAAAEAGAPLVVADVATSAALDEDLKQLCMALQILAYIIVPVMKAGRYAGNLCITQSTPRTWTALEVELAVETAERTWEAVARAHAEAALREGEEKYRTLFNSMEEGFCLIDMIFDEAGAAVDYRYLEANRAFEQRTGLANVVGRLGSEVTPGTEPHWICGYGAVARTGEPLRVENYHAPTGRWYRGYATRVGGEGSRQVAIVFDDITEHKRNEGRGEA